MVHQYSMHESWMENSVNSFLTLQKTFCGRSGCEATSPPKRPRLRKCTSESAVGFSPGQRDFLRVSPLSLLLRQLVPLSLLLA